MLVLSCWELQSLQALCQMYWGLVTGFKEAKANSGIRKKKKKNHEKTLKYNKNDKEIPHR